MQVGGLLFVSGFGLPKPLLTLTLFRNAPDNVEAFYFLNLTNKLINQPLIPCTILALIIS